MIALPFSAAQDSAEWLVWYRQRLQAELTARPRPEGEQEECERVVVVPE